MGIQISSETEGRLVEEARRQGISVETLLERLMNERAAASQAEVIECERVMAPGGTVTTELPVLHLGRTGALHRRDNYDDAC